MSVWDEWEKDVESPGAIEFAGKSWVRYPLNAEGMPAQLTGDEVVEWLLYEELNGTCIFVSASKRARDLRWETEFNSGERIAGWRFADRDDRPMARNESAED